MGKLRHIAINAPDVERAAQFFENAFGMERVGKGGRSIYLTDGVVNVTLLQIRDDADAAGLAHFGVWVDDIEAAEKKAVQAGAVPLGEPTTGRTGHYEAKFRDPDGLVFDLTHTGWPGATKDPAQS